MRCSRHCSCAHRTRPCSNALPTCPAMRSSLGRAHAGVAEAARRTSAAHVEREYFNLFIGVGRGELLPYGSYYLTGFLHERPLARLRQDLVQLGIERAVGQVEPEDHAAILCEVMAGLVSRCFPAPPDADRALFEAPVSLGSVVFLPTWSVPRPPTYIAE